MSKMVIRNGMFETNSSSVHSICISKKPVDDVKGKKINFYLGEFGWDNESVDVADYLYTAIMCRRDSDELLSKLKAILDKYNVEYTFQPEEKASRWWGIDHSYETSDFLNAVFEDEDLLLRCLFNNDSVVFTGNDNQEARYDACDQSEADISYFDRECKEWKSKPNPYHDETKYDYFIKGN